MISALFDVSAWIIAPPAANEVGAPVAALGASGLVAAADAGNPVIALAADVGTVAGIAAAAAATAPEDARSPP